MYDGNYLASHLSRQGAERLRKVVIEQPGLGRSTSYVDFLGNAEKSAQLLVDLGVKPGRTVLVYAEKSVSSIELYFGCLLAGAVYTPINPTLPAEDLGYFVDDADPALIICDKTRMAAFRGSASSVPVLTINADETGTFVDQRNAYAAGFMAIKRAASDRAAVLYTSGTTGRPKGVIHTHGSLWSNASVLAESWAFVDRDVLFHALPIFHLHGLFTAMNVILTAGASCIFVPRFDIEGAITHLPKCSVMMGVPPYYMSLLEDDRLAEAARNVRVFISGSAPMLPQTHVAWREKTGSMIMERYGMTECSMIASNPYDRERKPNSVGLPLPGTEVRVVDLQTGAPVEDGQIGMIQIRGPNLFDGYLNKPEKTAEDMTMDGYFISGDIGRYDDEGYLFVLGRMKDAIFSRAGVVIPKDVEEVIDAQRGVLECAVIGVPHPEQGQVPVAIYVGDKDVVVEDRIRASVQALLDEFKCPVKYLRVDELPRNTMGKVQKAQLRQTCIGMFDDATV